MIRLQLLGGVQLSAADGRDLRPLLGRPKRLALLAYLASREATAFVRRDVLTGLLWPEMDQSAARKGVRQALYVLRTDLGEDIFETAGDDEVRIAPERLWCDVPAFVGAVRSGKPEEALELYHGDLLPGFFVPDGGAGFEQWLEEERGRLRALAAKAAWDLAEGAERNRKSGPATTWGRKALALTHDDETSLRRLIQLLDRMGDRAGALRAYETFARRLKEEYDEAPSAETRALIARVRERDIPRDPLVPANAEPPAPPLAPTAAMASPLSSAAPDNAAPLSAPTPPPAAPAPARRRWRPLIAAAGVIVGFGGVLLYRARSAGPTDLSSSTRVSTTSAVAREHYRRGLEGWYAHGNSAEAETEMKVALAEDSTFAMAAYWLVNIIDWRDRPLTSRYLAQAVRMARFATPDEQRLIELQNGLFSNDPRVVPLSELLAAQYPRDLDVLVKASEAAALSGRYARSIELARRVIALDSGATTAGGPCASCEAYQLLTMGLLAQDSLAGAQQTVREWRSARPDDLRADRLMVITLEFQGRYEESRAVAQQLVDRGRGSIEPNVQSVSIALRQGDIDSARKTLRSARATSRDSIPTGLDWMLVSVLRHAGQLTEARRVVAARMTQDSLGWQVQLAQVAWDAGDIATAIRIVRPYLERQAATSPDGAGAPRNVAWWLTRASTYFATAGDTGALALAAARLEQLGQLSAFGRDQHAYHYPRALLAEARQQWAEAEAEFRAAILAPADGYTRINLQLAQLLQRGGRAPEAVPILRSALNTDMISGSSLFVTQTELHEALGQAFAALDQPDSARAHYDYVTRAWAHADPLFQPRLAAARAYLAAHPRP